MHKQQRLPFLPPNWIFKTWKHQYYLHYMAVVCWREKKTPQWIIYMTIIHKKDSDTIPNGCSMFKNVLSIKNKPQLQRLPEHCIWLQFLTFPGLSWITENELALVYNTCQTQSPQEQIRHINLVSIHFCWPRCSWTRFDKVASKKRCQMAGNRPICVLKHANTDSHRSGK